MKKVLILSYFFPPCNLTAANRIGSWAQHLHNFGYHPVIVTRSWVNTISSPEDVLMSSGKETVCEEHENYTVYYLPYRASWRDKMFVSKSQFKKQISRLLTFINLILQNFTNRAIPFENMYDFGLNYLKENPEIDKMIISGNPFEQYRFGYLLSKKRNVRWLADYRDAWSTSEIALEGKHSLFKVVNILDRYFEKKWVSTASVITASSKPIADGVTMITKVPSYPLYNGFNPEDFLPYKRLGKSDKFLITYVGTLYPGQDISIFINAYKQFIDANPQANTVLLFPGLKLDLIQYQRVKNLMRGYEKYFEATKRLPRSEVLKFEIQSHILLHVAWEGYSGIVASKIYEYLGSGTAILVTPNDHGAIEEILIKANVGTLTEDVEQTNLYLQGMYAKYLKGELETPAELSNSVLQFTRKKEVQKLVDILNEM